MPAHKTITAEELALKNQRLIAKIAIGFSEKLKESGHSVDDAIQEATFRVLKYFPKRATRDIQPGKEIAWLSSVVRTTCINMIQQKGSFRIHYSGWGRVTHNPRGLQNETNARNRVDSRLVREELALALSQLPSKQRQAIMHYINGMTFREMKERYGGTRQSWNQAYDRGIVRMRENFGVPVKRKRRRVA